MYQNQPVQPNWNQQPYKVELKPTWGFVWGIMWRSFVISIPFAILWAVVARILR